MASEPIGLSYCDVPFIKEIVPNALEILSKYDYDRVLKNDKSVFIMDCDTMSSFDDFSLVGKVILLDSTNNLALCGVTLSDSCEHISCDLASLLKNSVGITKVHKIKYIKDNSELEKAIHEVSPVFKQTLQFIINFIKEEAKKINKKVSLRETIRALSGNTSLKHFKFCDKESSNLIKARKWLCLYRKTSGGRRTISAYQDMCLFKTDFDTSVTDNVADPFSLKIMVDLCNPGSVSKSFKFFGNPKISKEVLHKRTVKDM